jgi:hypothetical protein
MSLLSDDNLIPKLPETYSFLTECDTQLLKVSLCDASMQPANCLLHVFKFLFQGNRRGSKAKVRASATPARYFSAWWAWLGLGGDGGLLSLEVQVAERRVDRTPQVPVGEMV